MSKGAIIAIIVIFICLVGASAFFYGTPTGVAMINNWRYSLHKVDDETNYETLKQVEDTARAMIATYERSKNEYYGNMELFNSTKDEYYRQVADGYRQQANTTASTYNNYILKNKYMWKDNIPDDICMKLDPIRK